MTYSPDDLDSLNAVLAQHPQVRELVDGIRALGDLQYPVDSFATLSDRHIDDTAGLAVLGTFAQAPAFYFPIASRKDLVAKLLELRRHSGPNQMPTPTPNASPASAPPTTVFVTDAGPLVRPRTEQSPPAPGPSPRTPDG
jgi:hypothetical protein